MGWKETLRCENSKQLLFFFFLLCTWKGVDEILLPFWRNWRSITKWEVPFKKKKNIFFPFFPTPKSQSKSSSSLHQNSPKHQAYSSLLSLPPLSSKLYLIHYQWCNVRRMDPLFLPNKRKGLLWSILLFFFSLLRCESSLVDVSFHLTSSFHDVSILFIVS